MSEGMEDSHATTVKDGVGDGRRSACGEEWAISGCEFEIS